MSSNSTCTYYVRFQGCWVWGCLGLRCSDFTYACFWPLSKDIKDGANVRWMRDTSPCIKASLRNLKITFRNLSEPTIPPDLEANVLLSTTDRKQSFLKSSRSFFFWRARMWNTFSSEGITNGCFDHSLHAKTVSIFYHMVLAWLLEKI